MTSANGQCFIWHNGACNGDNTVAFLDQLADWLGDDLSNTLIIWDGASYHSRCERVQHHADQLDLSLVSLPAYSPDLNPIGGGKDITNVLKMRFRLGKSRGKKEVGH